MPTFANGTLEGIDLGYELGRAEAVLRREALPATQNSRRTQFNAFKLSADITNGVAQTHDLIISSAALKVFGSSLSVRLSPVGPRLPITPPSKID